MTKRLFGQRGNETSPEESATSQYTVPFVKTTILTLFILGIGTTAKAEGVALATKNAVSICTTADIDWVNFCNGLIQGYADIAVLSGTACIPTGTTRTAMVTLFTDEAMKRTTAYQNDEPAVAAAMELFSKVYPCN